MRKRRPNLLNNRKEDTLQTNTAFLFFISTCRWWHCRHADKCDFPVQQDRITRAIRITYKCVLQSTKGILLYIFVSRSVPFRCHSHRVTNTFSHPQSPCQPFQKSRNNGFMGLCGLCDFGWNKSIRMGLRKKDGPRKTQEIPRSKVELWD